MLSFLSFPRFSLLFFFVTHRVLSFSDVFFSLSLSLWSRTPTFVSIFWLPLGHADGVGLPDQSSSNYVPHTLCPSIPVTLMLTYFSPSTSAFSFFFHPPSPCLHPLPHVPPLPVIVVHTSPCPLSLTSLVSILGWSLPLKARVSFSHFSLISFLSQAYATSFLYLSLSASSPLSLFLPLVEELLPEKSGEAIISRKEINWQFMFSFFRFPPGRISKLDQGSTSSFSQPTVQKCHRKP